MASYVSGVGDGTPVGGGRETGGYEMYGRISGSDADDSRYTSKGRNDYPCATVAV